MKKALIFATVIALVVWGVSGVVFADDPPPTAAETSGGASQSIDGNHGNDSTGGWAQGGSDGYYKSVAYGDDGDPTASGSATADGSLTAFSLELPFGPGPKTWATSMNDLEVGSTANANAEPSGWVKVDVSGGAEQGNYATVGPNTYLFGSSYATAGNKTQGQYKDGTAGDVDNGGKSTYGSASAYGKSTVSNDAVEPDDPVYSAYFCTEGDSSSSNSNVAGGGASSVSGQGSGSGKTTGVMFGVSGAALGGGAASYGAAGANSAEGNLWVTGDFSTKVFLGHIENNASVSSSSSSSSN